MILDGVSQSAIHFGRVILSRMVEFSRSQSFLVVYGRPLCLPLMYAVNFTLFTSSLSRLLTFSLARVY